MFATHFLDAFHLGEELLVDLLVVVLVVAALLPWGPYLLVNEGLC